LKFVNTDNFFIEFKAITFFLFYFTKHTQKNRISVSLFLDYNMKSLKKLKLAFFLFYFHLIQLVAQNAGSASKIDSAFTVDVLELSMEELLNSKVTVSSKKAERISDAPGSITAYSDKDIQNLGYYTLRDLANITAGYSSFKGIGETTFETRGQKQDGFDNNKHLVLIDGIPFNHARANMALAEENLPLFFAQRVEFLKGPGSALYGTSAFSGVINIISKDLEKDSTLVESKYSVGNNDFSRRAMMNIFNQSKMGRSKLCVGYFAKDNSNDFLGTGNANNYLSKYYDKSSNIFINSSHKILSGKLLGLSAGLIYSRKTGGLGEFWMGQQTQNFPYNLITWEQLVPYLKYEKMLFDKFSLNSYFKGNVSTENVYFGNWFSYFPTNSSSSAFGTYNIRVYDKEVLAEVKYKRNDFTNFIIGTNIISRYSTGFPENYNYQISNISSVALTQDSTYSRQSSTYNIYSIYAQFQHNINVLQGLNLTIGFREDIGRTYAAANFSMTNKYSQFSPRIAGVLKVNKLLNLKYILATALRAPLIKEVSVNEEAKKTVANTNQIPNLKAEQLISQEFVVAFHLKKTSLNTSIFINKTTHALGKIGVAGINGNQENIYSNLPGNISASGFEFEANYKPYNQLLISANVSFASAKINTIIPNSANTADSTVVTNPANIPKTKFNAFVTYHILAPIKLSSTLVAHVIDNYTVGGVSTATIQGYKLFDFNTICAISPNLNFELQVRNLLNATIRTPTFTGNGMLNIPNPGRTFMGTLSLNF